MVRALACRSSVPWAALALVLSGCAQLEAVVLVVRDANVDEPAIDAATEPSDAGDAGSPDAGRDAGPDTRGVCRSGGSKDGFYETFDGPALDPTRWLVAQGRLEFAGRMAQGGFLAENVRVEGGSLVLTVHGDLHAGGRRTGAAIVTRDLFASATYQAQGHLVGPPGVEFALASLRDDDREGGIDIATPGLEADRASYARVHMRSRDAAGTSETQFALAETLDDGASHILRFDWYTTAQSAVRFWVDDMPRSQLDEHLPMRAGRMWLLAWVPGEAAADFDTVEIRIENAFVTPFGNSGDLCQDGELSGPGLAPP
ncbi:MAG: glycoside hydrolase family 16 protein [Myxococcales bacterium]